MTWLNYNRKRAGLGILLGVGIFCVANTLLDLRLFGRFDIVVLTIVFVLMFFYIHLIGPSVSEIEENQKNKNQEGTGETGED